MGKKRGSRSLVPRAQPRSVDSHQKAFEPTSVSTSLSLSRLMRTVEHPPRGIRFARSGILTSRRDPLVCWHPRGGSKPKVNVNMGSHFSSRKGVAKNIFLACDEDGSHSTDHASLDRNNSRSATVALYPIPRVTYAVPTVLADRVTISER